MPVKTSQESSRSILSLKLMYYYAKIFGMVYFTITDRARLKCSLKSQLYSIVYRLSCLIGYAVFLPQFLSEILQIQQIHMRAIAFIQFLSVAVFTVVSITFQVIRSKQFINVVNKAADIFIRISVITRDSNKFGGEFYLIILTRIGSNTSVLVADMPRFLAAMTDKDFYFVVQYLLGYILWFGTLIVVDLLFLGYVTASGMYRNIGNHMISLVRRVEISEQRSMTQFRRMQVLCDFSDELEECSAIYSQIFNVTCEFHSLFQFNICLTFYTDLILIIGNIHHNFLAYVETGHITWSIIVLGVIRTVDFILLILVADSTVRRSKIPKCLNWDVLCSDMDTRWDRSVDHFLNQLRFEDLKIDVYGLFELNNELCLWVFSIIVAYVTILIQFSMLGYFRENS